MKEVDLSNIKINNITLLCKILKNNSCLRGLYLYSKQIKNLISFKFLSNSCLKILGLSWNKIKDIIPLQLLKNNYYLKVLHLSYNQIKKYL